MPLTPQQRVFIDNYISRNKAGGKRQRRLAEQQGQASANYARERDLALALLERLPASSQEFKDLDSAIKVIDKAAAVSADEVNFAQAASNMAALVRARKADVDGYDLMGEIARRSDAIARIERAGPAALAARQQAAADVAALKQRAALIPPGMLPPMAVRSPAWRALLTPLLQRYGAEADAIENEAHGLAATLAPLGQFYSSISGLPGLTKAVNELVKAARARDDEQALRQAFDLMQRLRFPQLAGLRSADGADQFFGFTAPKLEIEIARREVMEALRPLRDQLAGLQADAGADLLDVASSDFNADAGHDDRALSTPQGRAAPKRPPAARFDMNGLFGGMPDPDGAVLEGGSLNLAYAPDEQALHIVGRQAQEALVAKLKADGIDTHSEAFFDLSLQSPQELAAAFKAGKGWKAIANNWPEGQEAAAKAAGAAMFSLIVAMNARRKPDALYIDPSKGSLQFGGKNYGNAVELARGGMGAATRYENLDQPGDFVVVKSTIADPDDPSATRRGREDMKKEILSHQRLMGADADAEGRGNLAQMHAAVAAPDGSLHVVMEMIDGGDLATNRITDMLATDSGALPEEARAVLNQARIKQAAQALKLMRDEGMVHFDVKDANFMMTADGTLKLIDFGSAAATRDDGRAHVPGQVTEGFAAARVTDTADSGFDTFALGKVMQLMHVNASSVGQADNREDVPPEFQRMTGALARLGEAMTSADEGKRPTLEAVLQSSYLKNLDNYDPAAVQALSAKTIAYGKALKKETAAVLPKLPPDDVNTWAAKAKKQRAQLSTEDIVRFIKIDIEDMQAEVASKREQLEALGQAPQGRGLGANRRGQDRDATLLQRRELQQQLNALAPRIQARQDQMALFGQSADAKRLAQEMRQLSQQLLRPSGPDAPDNGPPQRVNVFAVNKLRRELGQRLTAADALIRRATLADHANVNAANTRYKAAQVMLRQDDLKKAQVLIDQVEGLLG